MSDYLASAVWAGAAYRITQPWGPTTLTVEPILNGEHFHCGIDIATPMRTPLFSPKLGKVVHVSWALLAITDGADCYWFVHIDSSVVTLSQWVSGGQLVAYSGNKVPSGGATTGPHLHFEVQNYPGARFNQYDANGRLVYLPGALNNPATSLDPVPVLSGKFASDAGDLLTPLSPTTPRRKRKTVATSDSFIVFGLGDDDALWYDRFDESTGKWAGLVSLGGKWLDFDVSGAAQRIDIYGRGTTARELWHTHSSDAGKSFAAWEQLQTQGGFKSPLVALGPGPALSATEIEPKEVSGTFSGKLA